MLKTSFIEIMRSLDKYELKRFESFLLSPYFNTRSNVVKLFSIVKKYSPDFDDEALEKEKIWTKIFPGKSYNYGILKNIIYDITKLSERFLEIEEFNSHEVQRMRNLLNMLSDRHIENAFVSKYNSFEKNYFRSSKFYNDFYAHYLEIKKCRFKIEVYNPKLHSKFIATEISELIIFDFIAKFSNNYNNFYIEEAELNEIPENKFIREFAKAVFSNEELEKHAAILSSSTDIKFKPLIIFFKLMKCYLNPHSIEYYFDFKKTLFENDKYISEEGLRGLYASLGSALDSCDDVSGVNKNREIYEIIFHLAEKNIFLSEEGKAIPTLYILAVKTAGYLKETDFIERVMKNYFSKLDPDLQDNFSVFSRAYLHYSKNEYDKALEFSNKISVDSFQMKFFLRNMQIMISYEKNDYDMFQYLCDSHKHFLSKNRSVTERYKESNMKFLNYTASLFKLRESNNKQETGFLINTLRSDTVVNKFWLLEKLEDIAE